jgi:hypothetical protein
MRLFPITVCLIAYLAGSLSENAIARQVPASTPTSTAAPAQIPGTKAAMDLLLSTYNFASPGNVYGPRDAQEMRARFPLTSDSPGIDVLNQNDANPIAAQHGRYIVVDDYHQFRGGSFGYLSLGAGSGNTVPLHNFYAEADFKISRSLPLVFGFGGDVTSSANGVVERYLSVGPTFYFKNGDTTLRFMPTSIAGSSPAPSGEFSFELGPNSPRGMLLTAQYGGAPPFLVQEGALATGGGQRAVDINLSLRNRIRGNVGIVCGFDYTHVADARSGNLIYTRRGFTIGAVRFFHLKAGMARE